MPYKVHLANYIRPASLSVVYIVKWIKEIGPWWLSGLDEHLMDMKPTVHDLDVMGSNPGLDELGACSTSV